MTSFTVDTIQIDRMSESLARFMGQYEWIAARAMTKGAIAAKQGIAREIFPMIQGGPSPWTRRGLIAKFATKDDLTAMAGFQYGEGKWTDSDFTRKAGGIPAGRYMGINAGGGDRRPKATELALRRAGLIGRDQFITPNKDVLKLNAQGNLPGGQYTQMLSRLRALGTTGNAAVGAGSRGRSRAKRRQLDYFVMRYEGGRPSRGLGGEPVYIAKRFGRGFRPAFFITDQPNYEARFPIRPVAIREFSKAFRAEFSAGVDRELARRAK